jgi:hypothetical protein
MDFSRAKRFTQREKNCIDKNVWEIVKCIETFFKAKDDDFDIELFQTSLSCPSKPIYDELETCFKANQSKRWSCTLFDNHLKIYDELVHLELFWYTPP